MNLLHRTLRVAIVLVAISTTVSLNAQDMKWETDFQTAMDLAVKQNKMLLLHFVEKDNRECRQLDTFVFTSAVVARDVHKNLVPIKVDIEKHPSLAEAYSISKVPFDVVVTTDGRIVTQRPSPKTISEYANLGKNSARIYTEPGGLNTTNMQNVELVKEKLKPKQNPLLLPDQGFRPNAPAHSHPQQNGEANSLAKAIANRERTRREAKLSLISWSYLNEY